MVVKIDELIAKMKDADDKEKIELLFQISGSYNAINQQDKALEYQKQALDLAQAIKNEKYMAICYHKSGILYWQKNEFATAMQNFEKALPLYQKLGNKLQTARLEMTIGVTWYNLGKNKKAITQLRQATCKIIRVKNKLLLGNAYNWLGVVYNQLLEPDKAMKYYLKGLVIQEKLEDKIGIGISKNSIGLLHLQTKHYDLAEKYFLESLQTRQEIDDKMGIADCMNNLGMLFHNLEDLEKSLQYYQKSLEIRKQIGGKAKMSHTYNNMGNIYAKMGKFEKAFQQHKLALKLREEIGNKANILQSKQNICNFLLENDKIEEGKKYLDECIEELSDKEAYPNEFYIYELKQLYYKKIGDFKQAYESQAKFHELRDKYNEEKHSAHIIELQAKYEMEKQNQENKYLQLKNVQLQNALETISSQNEELLERNDHIQLTSKILRHDIINNLSVMKSAMRLYNHSQKSSYLEDIPRQIEKSVNLLNKLGNLSRLLSDDKNLLPVDLRKDIFEKLIPNYSSLNIDVSGKGNVLADLMLESVFDNLFSNAVKHSGTEQIKIEILDRKTFIQINFADFGTGIPDEIKDKIFSESFSYGKTANTGLGLFIVKKTIENFGGSIKVQDNLPKGTVFKIKLKKA